MDGSVTSLAAPLAALLRQRPPHQVNTPTGLNRNHRETPTPRTHRMRTKIVEREQKQLTCEIAAHEQLVQTRAHSSVEYKLDVERLGLQSSAR